MRLIGKPLSQITLEDLRALVEDQVAESPILEYKETLPGTSDGDRKEFLADVSSFANASGGVIVYGIREKRDENGKPTGLPEAIVGLTGTTSSESEQRLGQMIRSGLDPALGGFLLRTLSREAGAGGFVLVLGVPASLLSPHAVAFATRLPFWRRVGMGKSSLTTMELRQMFSERDRWEQEAEAFRADRLGEHVFQPGRAIIIPQFNMSPALLLHVL